MKHEDICQWHDVCPLKRFYENGRLDKRWVKDYCWGDYSMCVRKKMKEENIYRPDNMMPDGTINESLK